MTRTFAVAGHLLDAEPSGASRRLLAILRELPPLLSTDERIVVLHGPSLPSELRPPGLEWAPTALPARPTWRRALAENVRLAPALERIGADVLDLSALPVPARLPCPVVLTIHDLRDVDSPFGRRAAWLARAVVRGSARRARHTVVPSRFTAEGLRRIAPSAQPRVVPGGVSAELLRIDPAPESERVHFLHVGHLEPRKDLAFLVTAYARYRRAAPRPRPLVLAGADRGDGAAVRRAAEQLGVREHVHLLGAVDDGTLRELYRTARAVVFPSRYEGFGLPALEALAVGVPLLAARAGALPEIAGETTILLPTGDAEAWSNALLAVDRRPVDAGEVARRKAQARCFSWRRAAEALLAVWREAAS